MPFDVQTVREQFPALEEQVHGKPLVYLDNAATAQMPRAVMEAVARLELCRGNVHRGIHALSERCTAAYEQARSTAAAFLGAAPEQVTFTAGATDGIDRVATVYERTGEKGVAVTLLEHHSNFVPWQQLCLRKGWSFRVIPLDDGGQIDLVEAERLLDDSVGLLAVSHCSNVLGTVTPVEALCRLAHSRGIRVLVDGAQSVCHRPIDVSVLDCDWFVCSGHKLGGPFGVGLLYAKEPMEPARFGGGMVDRVSVAGTSFAPPPLSGEAGTPNVSGAVGLAAAIGFRQGLDEGWRTHEGALLARAEGQLSALPGVRILGSGPREGCLSFVIQGVQPFDAAALLDQLGIAVRSGHHCAQPLLDSLGLDYALRVSPAYYNTPEEIEALVHGLEKIVPMLRRDR